MEPSGVHSQCSEFFHHLQGHKRNKKYVYRHQYRHQYCFLNGVGLGLDYLIKDTGGCIVLLQREWNAFLNMKNHSKHNDTFGTFKPWKLSIYYYYKPSSSEGSSQKKFKEGGGFESKGHLWLSDHIKYILLFLLVKSVGRPPLTHLLLRTPAG